MTDFRATALEPQTVEAGERRESRKSRPGGSGPRGLLNLAGVGSFQPRKGWNRSDQTGDRARKPGGEERNHERPDNKGLPVTPARDGAEPRKTSHRWVEGTLHVLPLEIVGRWPTETVLGGTRDMRCVGPWGNAH